MNQTEFIKFVYNNINNLTEKQKELICGVILYDPAFNVNLVVDTEHTEKCDKCYVDYGYFNMRVCMFCKTTLCKLHNKGIIENCLMVCPCYTTKKGMFIGILLEQENTFRIDEICNLCLLYLDNEMPMCDVHYKKVCDTHPHLLCAIKKYTKLLSMNNITISNNNFYKIKEFIYKKYELYALRIQEMYEMYSRNKFGDNSAFKKRDLKTFDAINQLINHTN